MATRLITPPEATLILKATRGAGLWACAPGTFLGRKCHHSLRGAFQDTKPSIPHRASTSTCRESSTAALAWPTRSARMAAFQSNACYPRSSRRSRPFRSPGVAQRLLQPAAPPASKRFHVASRSFGWRRPSRWGSRSSTPCVCFTRHQRLHFRS